MPPILAEYFIYQKLAFAALSIFLAVRRSVLFYLDAIYVAGDETGISFLFDARLASAQYHF